MTDLVERLREPYEGRLNSQELCREAADEIERLWAEVALWKDRYEAEVQAHEADIRAIEKAWKAEGEND